MLYNPTSLENIPVWPWWEVEDSKGNITVRVPTLHFIQFLGCLNYRYAYIDGYYQIVRIQDNIITQIKDNAEIIGVALKWLDENATGLLIGGVYKDQIKSAWINKTPQLFSPINLRFLPRLIVDECKDTKDTCYIFYTNTAIKITANSMVEVAYEDLPGHVFKQNIINRQFRLEKPSRLFNNTPYARFIYNISHYRLHRMKAFMAAGGYLMHKYKNPANAKAIILYDQPINELNAAHGGSGKTQYCKGISYMCNVCDLPGKSFKTNYAHNYQRVDRFTDVISLNDIQPNLKFDSLYNVISDDMTINKKYKPEFEIKFEDTPKFILASNYIIKAPEGHSTERRKYEIELSTHYGENKTIFDDFKHFFFFDWSENQWNSFSLFMMQCVQYYLKFGLIEAPSINLNERRLISDLGVELIEFLDEKIAKKPKHHKMELFKEFITGDYVSYKYRPTARTFTVKLKKYCDYKGLNYRETPSNTKAFIEIITDEDPINFTTIKDVDTNYKTVDSTNKMTRMVNAMTKHFAQADDKVLALDFETTGKDDPLTDNAVSLALCFKPRTGYNIMFPTNVVKRNKLIAPLLPFLEDDSITKVFQNAKFDLKFFNKLNIELGGEIADTMVMDYILNPSRKKHGLKTISKLHLNYKHIEFKQMLGDKTITEIADKDLTAYAVEDADLTLQLYHYLNKKLK
jgi:3'-5' exonuclease